VPHYTRKGEVYALGSKIDIKGCYVTNSDSFHGRARALRLFTCKRYHRGSYEFDEAGGHKRSYQRWKVPDMNIQD